MDWTGFSKIDRNDSFTYLGSLLEYGAIVAFLWVSKVITSIKIYSTYIFESPIIRDYIQYGKDFLHIFYKTTEPKNDWASVCSTTKNQLNETYIHENHSSRLDKGTDPSRKIFPKPAWLLYRELYETALLKFKSGLFVMKIENQYIYRNISETVHAYRILPSKTRFILVEYKCPNLKDSIYLDIPKTAYISGNEILSKIHVIRCLAYQNEPCDENYTLHIMDNKLKEFVMYPSQYCVLHFDHYEIIDA